MTCYILDSDHVTPHQRRHPVVVQRLAGVPSARVFVSIVTVEEQLRGWLALIRRAPTPERLIAANHFAALHAQRIRIGTQDLRIAAMTLAVSGILVTRNRVDFQQVPGLLLEDWSEMISSC